MAHTLSQTQIIRSLGQALEWFEKEVAWGTPPGELNHLTGRIGELYAAMVTRGQMAQATNQKGYDVVSLEGDRISVKTITTSKQVSFNAATFDIVDRVMILRLNVDDDEISIEEVLDCSADKIRQRDKSGSGKYVVPTSGSAHSGGPVDRRQLPQKELRKLSETASAMYTKYRIVQYENGSILVESEGVPEATTKPVLRKIAKEVGVDIHNSSGNRKNTRSLGADIIKHLT